MKTHDIDDVITPQQLHAFRNRLPSNLKENAHIIYLPFSDIQLGKLLQIFEEEAECKCDTQEELLRVLMENECRVTGTDPGRGTEVTLPPLPDEQG